MSYIPQKATEITDIARNQSVNVESLNAFDDVRVGNIVTLTGDVSYNITKSFSWENIEFIVDPDSNITFLTSNAVSNDITTSILTGRSLFSGALSRLEFQSVNMTSINGGTCFNFTAGNNVVPALIISNPRIVGFDKVGILDGVAVAIENVGYIGNADGWSINDAPLINMAEQNMIFGTGINYDISGTTPLISYSQVASSPLDANIVFNISGTVGQAIFNTIFATPQSGGFIFNIDAGITITTVFQILNGSLNTSLGGLMFDPSGLDETDPRILVKGVFNAQSSYKIGLMGMMANTTATTINTAGVYEDIAGTILGDSLNERFTFSGDTLTYIGLEDIKSAIDISIFMKREVAAASRVMRFGLFLNDVLHQEFEATMSSDTTNSSFTTIHELVTGDDLKLKIQNTQDTANVIVTDYNFRVIEA